MQGSYNDCDEPTLRQVAKHLAAQLYLEQEARVKAEESNQVSTYTIWLLVFSLHDVASSLQWILAQMPVTRESSAVAIMISVHSMIIQ